MAIFKGKSPMWFLIGIPFLIAGAWLYWKSEDLSGWNNVAKGRTLEWIGGVVFLLGLICWGIMFKHGFKRVSK